MNNVDNLNSNPGSLNSALNVAKIFTNLVDLDNYFQKSVSRSFIITKTHAVSHIIVTSVSVETLAGVATRGEGGGGGWKFI
jgi:hypothetical protein